MGASLPEIDDKLAAWLRAQTVFFVATAPLAADGHINCSPKGCDTFRVIDPKTVAYLDLTGSGAETIAHLRENGRLVIMFCAFEGSPLIVRLHGRGETLLPEHPDFAALIPLFPKNPGTRSIIRLHLSRVSSSCGMGVPTLEFVAARDDLDQWAIGKGTKKLAEYRARKNLTSIDGLPAIG